MVADLRALAETSAAGAGDLPPHQTVESDAADAIETASRALRDIRDGAPDPKAIAAVALMAMGDRDD